MVELNERALPIDILNNKIDTLNAHHETLEILGRLPYVADNYLRNLKNLKIVRNHRFENIKISGLYIPLGNILFLGENVSKETEVHERTHIASSNATKTKMEILKIIIGNKFITLGGIRLYSRKAKRNIGETLNEGITEYFSSPEHSLYAFPIYVAKIIAFIYGEEIYKYYFKQDGLGFIRELGDTDKAIKLMDKVDECLGFDENFTVKEKPKGVENDIVDLLIDLFIAHEETTNAGSERMTEFIEKINSIYDNEDLAKINNNQDFQKRLDISINRLESELVHRFKR